MDKLIIVLSIIICIILLITLYFVNRNHNQIVLNNQKTLEKNIDYYQILVTWLKVYQNAGVLSDWIKRRGYEEIAIYGIREMGQLLHDEILMNGLKVKYWIDQKPEQIYCDEHVYNPNEDLPNIDLVVVSAPYYYSEIEKVLREKGIHNIVSIADIVFDCVEELVGS